MKKRRFGLRTGVQVLLDLYYFVDPKYIRQSQTGIKKLPAIIFPRLYFVTVGLIKRINPNHIFNSEGFSTRFIPGTLSHRFPTIKYLTTSTGKTPQSQFDRDYISKYPDLREFRKPLLVHYLRFTKFHEGDFEWKNSPRYVYRSNLWASATVSSAHPISIKLIVNSCRTVDFLNFNDYNMELLNFAGSLVELKHQHIQGFLPLSNEVRIENLGEFLQISLKTHGNLLLNLEHLMVLLRKTLATPENLEAGGFNLIDEYLCKSDYNPNFFSLVGANQTFSAGTFRLNDSKRITVDFMHRKFDIEKMSKIFLVSHDDSLSGAPLFALQLYRQLVARNYEVKIVILKKLSSTLQKSAFANIEDDIYYLEDLGIPAKSFFNRARETVDLEKGLKYLFLAFRPDLLIANTVVSAEAVITAESLGIPTVLLVHETWGFSTSVPSEYTPLEAMISGAFEGANLVVFGSSSAQAKWEDPRLRMNSIVLPSIRSMSEVPKINEYAKMNLREQFNIPQNAYVYLSIGSFEERKRTLDAIHAFVNLETSTDFLILVGDWKKEDVYCATVRDLASKYTNIKIVSTTSNLEPFYLLADCFIFMSETEVYPLVLQEAAIFGLVRITSRYSGYLENLKIESSALSYEVGDVDALTHAMRIIRDDPVLRREIIRLAEEVVTENNVEAELYFDHILERLNYPHITKVKISLND
jgi:glycosyltransferase involved in cell wall biosynthesis